MTLAFDTLKFTQRLERVGVGREQAVARAELARDMILADPATKADPIDLEKEIAGSLCELECGSPSGSARSSAPLWR